MSLGERITELRKLAGMSQAQLADALDVSRQAVSKWETDQSNPDSANLIRLSDVLDTDVEYLTTGRKTFGMRPPVVIETTKTVEKIVEKPVIQVKEVIVEKIIEKPIERIIEKPIVKKVYRTQYIRNPFEYALIAFFAFLAGLLAGLFL